MVKRNYPILLGYDQTNALHLLWSPDFKKNFADSIPAEAKINYFQLKSELAKVLARDISQGFQWKNIVLQPNVREKDRLIPLEKQRWLEIPVEVQDDAAHFEKFLPKLGVSLVIIGQATQQIVTLLAAQLLPGSNDQNYALGFIGGVCTLLLSLIIYYFYGHGSMKDIGRYFDSFFKQSWRIAREQETTLIDQGVLRMKTAEETLKVEKMIASILLILFTLSATATNAITYFESAISLRENIQNSIFSKNLVYVVALITLIVGAFNSIIVTGSFCLKTVEPLAKKIHQGRLFCSHRTKSMKALEESKEALLEKRI